MFVGDLWGLVAVTVVSAWAGLMGADVHGPSTPTRPPLVMASSRPALPALERPVDTCAGGRWARWPVRVRCDSTAEASALSERRPRAPSGAYVGVGVAVAVGVGLVLRRPRHRDGDRWFVDPNNGARPTQVAGQQHGDEWVAGDDGRRSGTSVRCHRRHSGDDVCEALLGLGSVGLHGADATDAARSIVTVLLAPDRADSVELVVPEPDMRALLGDGGCDDSLAIPPGVTVTATAADALQQVETKMIHRMRLFDRIGCGDTEPPHPQDPTVPLVLVAHVPEQHTPRLEAILAARHTCYIAAVTIGIWVPGGNCAIDIQGQVSAVFLPGGDVVFHPDELPGPHTRLFDLPVRGVDDLRSTLTALLERELQTQPNAVPAGPRDTSGTAIHGDPQREPTAPEKVQASPPRALVELTVLGLVRVYVGGAEVRTGLRNRARELLAYLASHRDGVTLRGALADIWPDGDPERAAAQFRTACANIRKVLRDKTDSDADFLVYAGGRYRLDPQLIDVDVWHFTDHLAHARSITTEATATGDGVESLAAAVDIYRADFAEWYPYEWAEPIRQELHRNAIDACARLADLHEQQHNLDRAAVVLDRAVHLDPYNEELYRSTMSLLARLGRVGAVRSLYELLQTRLAELDLRPSKDTARLARDHLPRLTE